MWRLVALYCVGCCYTLIAFAQQEADSTAKPLRDIIVNGYPGRQPLRTIPASVASISRHQLNNTPGHTLLPAMNTVAGVRMEERSPGSYRLSVRGSLLRSPFGVRNIKVYLDEFPFTDAGGNTYVNLLDQSSVAGIEVLKGPDGSLFGANSGGVVLFYTGNASDSSSAGAGITGGSYSLLHQKAGVQVHGKKYHLSLRQAYQRSDGYRENSALQKKYFQSTQRFVYNAAGECSLLLLYSDLAYETPGGLTFSQWQQNRRQARPASATLPGATEQQAAVYNRTLFVGVSNAYDITSRLRNVAAVSTSFTDFNNPFITNYEKRDEKTLSFRSYVELKDRNQHSYHWKLDVGAEWQATLSDVRNYNNNGGVPDTLQTADELDARQYFYFTRTSFYFLNRITVEAALSLNFYTVRYGVLPSAALTRKDFTPRYMPRVAVSYQFAKNIVARASVSKGYSTPTLQEIRSSDQVINTQLGPEQAWNYEAGLRLSTAKTAIDVSVFYYRLYHAIVRRVNDNGEEYFVNAGGTQQPGIEWLFSNWLVGTNTTRFLRGLLLTNSYACSFFTFDGYIAGDADYSGNDVTGVPKHVVTAGLNGLLPAGFFLFAQYYFASRIPLNDANTVHADPYHLVQLKAGWKRRVLPLAIELFAGCDNLLNQAYSLGNDLNAAGGRYYNAAPPRNYYAGVSLAF